MIQDFIDQLVQKAGISPEQAAKAAGVAHEFIKSKLPPQMASTVDSFFGGSYTAPATEAPAAAKDWTDKAKDMASDAGDKVADFAGKAKDKAEDFAEDAGKKMGEWADKAGDVAENVMDQLKGMLGGKQSGDKPA